MTLKLFKKNFWGGRCLYFSFSTHKQCILSQKHNSIAMFFLTTLYPGGIRTRVCCLGGWCDVQMTLKLIFSFAFCKLPMYVHTYAWRRGGIRLMVCLHERWFWQCRMQQPHPTPHKNRILPIFCAVLDAAVASDTVKITVSVNRP
jgi:hypothetical protein